MESLGRKSEVLSIKHLPPLSGIAARLLEMAGDADVDIDDLAKVISQDPGLSARVLGVANSAYFSPSRPINTVRDAIIKVLGLNMVKSLALSIAMCGAFNTRQCRGFSLEDYWVSALGCATLAREVSRHLPDRYDLSSDSAYLCGVMWNLGTLVLAHLYPAEMSAVFAALEKDPTQNVLDLELRTIGANRQQAGEWVAERWHMPDAVVATIGNYTDRAYQGDFEAEVLLVGACSEWVGDFMSGGSAALAEDDRLKAMLGISVAKLEKGAEHFMTEFDNLRATARMLG